jgi:hypothetical protein
MIMILDPRKMISAMVDREERGLQRVRRISPKKEKRNAKVQVGILFFLVVLGILANWLWGVGWEFIATPDEPPDPGNAAVIIVRVFLAFIAAAVTFTNVYTKIDQSTSESWLPYFIAFQNGFFWDALFNTVASSFNN